MIDIKNLRYKVVLVKDNGQPISISSFQQGITWEENTNELAVRANLELVNEKIDGVYLSTMAKHGVVVLIYFNSGLGDTEVFRGKIEKWNFKEGNQNALMLTVYDMLYNMQKSRDNRLYKSGASAKTRLLDLFTSWGVPIGLISGLDISLSKKAYRNEYLSDIVYDVLSDVKSKGYGKYVICADRGKVSVVKSGSNKDVYYFDKDSNVVSVSDESSTEDLITRVKIVGKRKVKYKKGEKKFDDNSVVEAVVDGRIDLGIRQEILNRDQDEKLSDAKSAAQDIIDDRGKPKRTSEIQAPDVPFIRKGHKVHLNTGSLKGFFIVKGIQHDAGKKTMTMEVEPA